jgi:hypothetical protein
MFGPRREVLPLIAHEHQRRLCGGCLQHFPRGVRLRVVGELFLCEECCKRIVEGLDALHVELDRRAKAAQALRPRPMP